MFKDILQSNVYLLLTKLLIMELVKHTKVEKLTRTHPTSKLNSRQHKAAPSPSSPPSLSTYTVSFANKSQTSCNPIDNHFYVLL